MILFLDFETYFDRKINFDLKSISITEYIRDDRFAVQGLGVCWEGKNPVWLKPDEIQHFLSSFDATKTGIVAHNAKFDGAILAWKYGFIPQQYICTQAMANAVLGTTVGSMSLDSLAKHYDLEPKGFLNTDGKKDLTEAEAAELAAYGLHDVELLVQIFNKLKGDFPSSQYGPMDWTIRAFTQPSLVLDVPILQKCAIQEKARREAFFQRPGWDKEIFSSNKKFPAFLQQHGYEVPVKTSPRTNKQIPALALGDPQFLDMLEGDDYELKEICEARVAAKSTLLETRSEKLARIGRTGNWPFDIGFSGAKQTHRYSGGSGAGGNPQNFSRGSDLRKAVRAPEGKTLIVGDFAQIELRINAWLCGQENLKKALTEGRDIYCDYGSEYYGRKITKEDIDERQFSKTAMLGLGYSASWSKFQKICRLQTGKKITDNEARRAVDLFRSMYWNIPKYWNYLHDCMQQMSDGGFGELMNCAAIKIDGTNIVLPSGLAIRYPNLRLDKIDDKLQWVYDAYRKGKQKEMSKLFGAKILENLCQAIAGEICKEAIERYKTFGGNPVGQCHDEILAVENLDIDVGQMDINSLKACMEASPVWMPNIVLKAEVKSGQNWLECK
jgi:hypothetical protein